MFSALFLATLAALICFLISHALHRQQPLLFRWSVLSLVFAIVFVILLFHLLGVHHETHVH
jgi:hypothetical protein